MEFFLLLLAFAAGQCIAKYQIHRHSRLHLPLQTDVNPHIVGGENAEITSFPYQISLMVNGKHNCGGSILDKDYIVTAAHCTDRYKVSNLSIRAGSSFISTGGTVVNISEIIQHESFNFDTRDYDIAVLKLNSSLSFSESIQSIPLATVMLPAETKGNITGWGNLKENGSLSNQLQVAEISITLKLTCELRYPSQITERMFCAGTHLGDKDACQSDSDGPFAVNRTLVGIVSWGEGCARPGTPGVYESVPALAEWIRSKTTAAP